MTESNINIKIIELKEEIALQEKKFKDGLMASVRTVKNMNKSRNAILACIWIVSTIGIFGLWFYLLFSGKMYDMFAAILPNVFPKITDIGLMLLGSVGCLVTFFPFAAVWRLINSGVLKGLDRHYQIKIVEPFPLVGGAVDNEEDALYIAGNEVPVDHYEVVMPSGKVVKEKVLYEDVVFFCNEKGDLHSVNMSRYGLEISKSEDGKTHYVTRGGTRLVSLLLPDDYWKLSLAEKFDVFKKKYRG